MIIATATSGNTVTFNANGGTGLMTNETASTPTALTLNGFTFAGHVFTGWNTVAGGGGTAYADGATYPFSASTTLYAQWAATFTVTFDGNTNTGGATAAETAAVPTALTPNGFTKTGYNFTGWNTLAGGGGTAYGNGATYPFSASTTLYAQWAAMGGGGGGGGGGSSPATLTITAGNITVTAGGSVGPSASVSSGLISPDTGTVTAATYTYAGTGSTVYAASTTAPSAAGSYSITPSAATVTITPSTDASKYSTTYTYVAGTLTITAVVTPPPPVVPTPHAIRVVGDAIVGESRTLTIVGRYFSASPGVTSNEPGATVRVKTKSAGRIVLTVTVRKGSHIGTHLFTITTSAGKECRIGYVTR